MTDSFQAEDKFDINVALKVVRHISSGIYRDRAGSLRELVSNCFDASATDVSIDTGYPRHDRILIRDNGFGINEKLIRKAFTQVGLSLKVTDPDLYKSDRPVIGKFGIGFLAAAHISHDVWIRSFPKGEDYGVEAKLDLEPYFLYKDSVETFDQFKYGTVQLRRIEREKDDVGTTVELRGVRVGHFYRIISTKGLNLARWPAGGRREQRPGETMRGFVEAIQSTPNLLYVDRLSGREQVMWHLAMSCPVEYLDGGPIRPGYGDEEALKVISELREYNARFDFRIWYDGLQLRKPILLPTTQPASRGGAEDPDLPESVLLRPLSVAGEARGNKRVEAKGYLFYQPWRIVPAETRGLYPRLAGVGIGNTFENRFLSYLTGENPVLRVQISGELYVLKGLDDALNLDRSGFMELDPEYVYLAEQSGAGVRAFFANAKNAYARTRRTRAAAQLETSHAVAVEAVRKLSSRIGQNYEVRAVPSVKPSDLEHVDFKEKSVYPPTGKALVVVDHSEKTVTVTSAGSEDKWVRIAVYVDYLLGKYLEDPEPARREFARELRRVLESED